MASSGSSASSSATSPYLRSVPTRGLTLPQLPRPLTSLIGREQEVADVVAILRGDDGRLVTLTGPGGVGKTRLALRVAEVVGNQFPDRAAFVPLATVSDPAHVLPTIARALGMSIESPAEAAERLGDALRPRELLLVLDNVEQVRLAASSLADLLAASPRVRLLITSRTRLRISGERVIPVRPLAVPDETFRELERLAAVEAVQLFLSRAQQVLPGFALTVENAPAIAQICRRLDGLPLAIELAAARIDVLPPRALLTRLERRLSVLTGGPHDAPPRQRTLWQTIAWSYDRLAPEEQRLFARLAVFAGGFTLAGAEAVADAATEGSGGESSTSAIDAVALEHVTSLVEHHLVQRKTDEDLDGEPRFDMLESIRDYAQECLEQRGEAEGAGRLHAAFFRSLAASAAPELNGPQQREWLDRLEGEVANLRSALAWALTADDADLSLSLASDLFMFWLKRGYVAEGRAWVERALTLRHDTPSPARLRALVAAAGLAGPTGDIPRASEALALARQMGDLTAAGRALHLLGGAAMIARTPEAVDLLEQALALLGDQEDRPWHAMTLVLLGFASLRVGEVGRAVSVLQEAIAVSTEYGEIWVHAMALNGLASVVRSGGEYTRAADHYLESLELALGLHDGIVANEALVGLAGVFAGSGQAADAARLFGAAEVLREAMGTSLNHLMVRDQYERDVTATRQALGQATFAAVWAQGRAIAPNEILIAAGAAAERQAESALPARGAILGRSALLTVREREILRLVAEGRTDREIATILFISTRTVEFHVANILGKLGAENRRAAATIAARLGLV